MREGVHFFKASILSTVKNFAKPAGEPGLLSRVFEGTVLIRHTQPGRLLASLEMAAKMIRIFHRVL